MDKANRTWMRLDNMANLFPAIERFSAAPIYRVQAELDRKVESQILKEALDMCLKRFPYFKVRLKKGLFWAYLESNRKPAVVWPDGPYPCAGMDYRANNHYLFRLRCRENAVALEALHALTDGGGSMVFLKTLVAQYLRLCGEKIEPDKGLGVWDIDEEPDEEEFADSFLKYYNKDIKSLGIKSPAYHFRGTRHRQDVASVICGQMSGRQVAETARNYGLSVTEYLVAVYVRALLNVQGRTKNRRPVRVSVPVNLRNFFPSKSMRNFTNFILCEADPRLGSYRFEDIAAQVHHTMRRGLIKNNLIKSFSGNVNSEKNFLVRALPLGLKTVILSLIYHFKGENQYSGSLSNLGVVKLPPDMERFVESFSCYLAPNTVNPTNCGAVCYKDKLVVSFTRTVRESHIEREFFSFLVKQGVKVKVKSGS
ncbi:MAG: hypothetical protein GX304_04160 [Clostridiales bacterium]|nr:hypothetical protein [Clostridiales bacterium]